MSYLTSREVADAAGIPYPTLMRWLHSGILTRRGPARRAAGGGGLLWTSRDLQEARIAGSLRDYISRAEGPLYEVMLTLRTLEELPPDPALHVDGAGKPHVVEYDPSTDDLRLFASREARRTWARRRTPAQSWMEMDEIHALDTGSEQHHRPPTKANEVVLDLFPDPAYR